MERESLLLFDVYENTGGDAAEETTQCAGNLIYADGAVYKYELPVVLLIGDDDNDVHTLLSLKRQHRATDPHRLLSPQVIDELRALSMQPDRDRGDPDAMRHHTTAVFIVDVYITSELVRFTTPSRLVSLLQTVLLSDESLKCARCHRTGSNMLDTADHQVYCTEDRQCDARVARADVPSTMMRPESGRVGRPRRQDK